jgi:hypothetical protein
VAELETDAKLGRMVREMPYWCELQRWASRDEPWTVKNFIEGRELGVGTTPLAALEAARKEEE